MADQRKAAAGEPFARALAQPVPLGDLEAKLADGWTRGKTRVTNRGKLTLFEPSEGGRTRLVVKECPDWTEAQIRRLATTMSMCEAHARDRDVRPFVAAPRSWGFEPDYVCTDWIEGSSVDEWLADELEDLPSSEAVERTLEVAAGMSALMARFHASMSERPATSEGVDEVEPSTGSPPPMSDRFVSLLAGRTALVSGTQVYSVADPGPHNTIRDAGGALWLIDLPADVSVVPVERDIARLVSRVVGAIHRHSSARWVPYQPVVEAVVDGYHQGCETNVSVRRSLVYACLASDAAVKALLTRRRLPPGTRLECLIRESAAAIVLGATALRSRIPGGRTRRR